MLATRIEGECTMTITRVGTSKKYAEGWEAVFGGKKKAGGKSRSRTAAATRSSKKKTSAKKGGAKKAAARAGKSGKRKSAGK